MANEVFVHLHIANVNSIKTKKVGFNLIKNHINFVNEYGKKIPKFINSLMGKSVLACSWFSPAPALSKLIVSLYICRNSAKTSRRPTSTILPTYNII